MPFQRVPNTVEIVIQGVIGGQSCVNTFYGQMDGGYAIADVEDLASVVDGWVAAEWLPVLPANFSYLRTDVRGLNASIDLSASDATSAGVGAQPASTQPNNASFAVSRRSAFTGRGARGRVYVPPLTPGAMLDDNHVSAAWAENFRAALEALDTVISGTGFVPVIVHRVAAGVPLAEAVVFTLVEWVVVDLVMDSMRRRLPGRGV